MLWYPKSVRHLSQPTDRSKTKHAKAMDSLSYPKWEGLTPPQQKYPNTRGKPPSQQSGPASLNGKGTDPKI